MIPKLLLATLILPALMLTSGSAGAQEEVPEATMSAATAPPSDTDMPPRQVLHIVREGEFLHMMASYYYGNSRLWTKIYEDNKNVIKNPNHIRPGMRLHIRVPADWKAPMPYDEWHKLAREGATGGKISLIPPPEEKEIEEEEEPGAKMSVMGEVEGDEDGDEDIEEIEEEVFE